MSEGWTESMPNAHAYCAAEVRWLRQEVRDYQAMRRSDGADLARLHAQRDAALALHKYRVADNNYDWCDHCQDGPWPCATVRALGVTK